MKGSGLRPWHSGLMRICTGAFFSAALGVASVFAGDAAEIAPLILAGSILALSGMAVGALCVLGLFATVIVSLVRDPALLRRFGSGELLVRRVKIDAMLDDLDEAELKLAEERIESVLQGGEELFRAARESGTGRLSSSE